MSKPQDTSGSAKDAPTRPTTAREQRLAQALRANLRRRKAPAPEPGSPSDEGAV
jgi:hypothetical protein